MPSLVAVGAASAQMTSLIQEIRKLPQMAGFLEQTSLKEIAEAAKPGAPIGYVVTAPHGSVVLLVWGGEEPEVELIEAPDLTSTDIADLLFSLDPASGDVGGYLLAQVGETDDLDDEIAALSAQLGDRLLKPMARALAARDAKHVSLIPAGITGLLPLHCLTWTDATGERSLLDDVTCSFVPSARTRLICARRADDRSGKPQSLVVVGNPLPHSNPLPGAESEAAIVSSSLSGAHVTKLIGTTATKDEVVRALPGATHVHFACHGWSDMREDVLTAHLSLAAEEPLLASEIIDIQGMSARLVVASACQTAIFQGYETADEVLGLPTAFLAAGGAGVVATFWPVDDYATALLMSRFYELLEGGDEPPSALRLAQLWLRDLTLDEEDRYIQNNSLLRSHRIDRMQRASGIGPVKGVTPFSAPSLWAAFAISGA